MQGLLKDGFVGREWLFKEIEDWLENDKKRKVFCLTGEPGIGKSALVAQFTAQNRVQIAGIHFCNAGSNLDSPRDVILSLAFQMGTRLPAYRSYLLKHNLNLANLSDADLFTKLITEASSFGIDGSQQPYLFIIDGLDEAQGDLAAFIAQHCRELPSWLYFIVTSRPNDAHVKAHLQAMNPKELAASSKNNEEDARLFVEKWLAGISLAKEAQKRLANKILKASAANFRYLAYLKSTVDEGLIKLEEFDQENSPFTGLGSLYQSSLERIYPDADQFAKEGRPVLSLLAVCGTFPTPMSLLVPVLKKERRISESQTREILLKLGSLVRIGGNRIPQKRTARIYHKSVTDWLLSDENTKFIIYKEEAADQIIRYLLEMLKKIGSNLKDGYDNEEELRKDWKPAEEFRDNYAALLGKLLLKQLCPGSEALAPDLLDNFNQDALEELDFSKEDLEKNDSLLDSFTEDVIDDWSANKTRCDTWDIILYLLRKHFYGDISEETILSAYYLYQIFTMDRFPDWAPEFASKQYQACKKKYGAANKITMDALDNLLGVYEDHPDLAYSRKGAELARKNIEPAQKLFGKNSGEAANLYSQLAKFTEDINEAESFHKKVKRIWTWLFNKWLKSLPEGFRKLCEDILEGNKHPYELSAADKELLSEIQITDGNCATGYYNALLDYAEFLNINGRYNEALKLIEKACDLDFFQDNLSIRGGQNFIAAYLGLGDYDEAIEWAQLAYDEAVEFFGKDSEAACDALSGLADVFEKKGVSEENNEALLKAEHYKRQAISEYASVLPNGSDTVCARIDLSRILLEQGQREAAYQEATRAYESCLVARVANQNTLESAWKQMFKSKLALKPDETNLALEINEFIRQQEDHWGENDRHVFDALRFLLGEWIYSKEDTGMPDAARKLANMAAHILNSDDSLLIEINSILGWEEYFAGNYTRSHAAYEKAIAIAERLERTTLGASIGIVPVLYELKKYRECVEAFAKYANEGDLDESSYIEQLGAIAAAKSSLKLGDGNASRAYLKNALELAEEREDEEDMAALKKELAKAGKKGK